MAGLPWARSSQEPTSVSRHPLLRRPATPLRSERLLLVAIVLASLTACGQATDTKSSEGTAVARASATTSITASPTGSPASSNELGLTIHMIPESWANATGITVGSDGTEVVWSAINALDPRGQPYMADIVSFVPGRDAEPRIIYRHPDRDSLILNVAVRHGRYAGCWPEHPSRQVVARTHLTPRARRPG